MRHANTNNTINPSTGEVTVCHPSEHEHHFDNVHVIGTEPKPAPKEHLILQCELYMARGQLSKARSLLGESLKNADHLKEITRERISGLAAQCRELETEITNVSEWAESDL